MTINKYLLFILILIMTSTSMSIMVVSFASASGLSLQPLRLNDIITLIASIDYELFNSLQYVKDYVTASSTFLIKVIEEAITSKHDDVINVSSSFQYGAYMRGEGGERGKDNLTIRSRVSISIEGGSI